MFSTLYLLLYNNYYNRLVKKEDNLNDYLSYLSGEIQYQFNFNPNDGVYTEAVVNIEDNTACDYLIECNEYNEIKSRWFIIESKRIRGKQYRLSLYRDTIADYYNIIATAPAFIEKATLPINNPLIFNNENMSFNQIKTNETLLKDRSGCAWLVGYLAKNLQDTTITVRDNNPADTPFIAVAANTIEDWEFYKYSQGETFLGEPLASHTYNFIVNIDNLPDQSIKVNATNGNTEIITIPPTVTKLEYPRTLTNSQIQNAFVAYDLSRLNPVPYSNTNSQSAVNELLRFNGSIIKTENGKYYNISITGETQSKTIKISSGQLFDQLSEIVNQIGITGTPNSNTFSYSFIVVSYTLSYEERPDLATTIELNADTLTTTDAPYDIIAIPYGDITIRTLQGGGTYNPSPELGVAAIHALQLSLGTNVYDIQLLPYCPILNYVQTDGEIRLFSSLQYSLIKQGDTTQGFIFHVPKANFSFDITSLQLPIATSAIEKKVNNECDKWRLCSPNYSNYFDFSVEKNGGVQFFNVDCTYKPFSPYIHINPNFSGLYGKSFNDPRGLVLGGDFSLAQISDAWVQYEIQNKNYQLTFDRQIQNMEFNNKIARTTDIIGAAAGTLQGAATGGLATSLFGAGPIGASIGAAIGGTLSAGAGIADIFINESLRNETLDYTKDLFGYQLGNIKALPLTLSKISAFNLNNKIFPVLEYYTATDVEKEALRNKIKYNGMTVMTIGTIGEYQQSEPTYIKGQLIRIEDLDHDYHLAKTIAKELNQGIYI